MMSLQGVFISISMLALPELYIWLYSRNKNGPFFGQSILCFVFCLFFALLACLGLYGNIKENIPKDDSDQDELAEPIVYEEAESDIK